MTLQFILGKAGNNHNEKMTALLRQNCLDNPNDKFFCLVPNHVKFESEVEIIQSLAAPEEDVTAQSAVQVLSFSRLAWFFLRDTPEYQKRRISPAGLNMLLYEVVEDNQDRLVLFNQEVHRTGFIDQLAKQIVEFQAGNVADSDLLKILANDGTKLTNDLVDKLKDFALIYTEFSKRLGDDYFDTHNVLNILSEYIQKADISDYHFYISDFSRFTAQEMQLVKVLIENAAGVTISLTLDRPYPVELPADPSLFYQPAKLFNNLYQFASHNKIAYLAPIFADRLRINNDLSKLEDYWIHSNEFGAISGDNQLTKNGVEVIAADSSYVELNQVATRIRQAVSSGKYRYSDFLVMGRRLDKYQDILEPVFGVAGIPFFRDIQESMADHPLVELLGALFAIYKPGRSKNYRYDDMMRLLKSELIIPKVNGKPMRIDNYRQAVFLTENLVLKNGLADHSWLQESDWQYIWLAADENQTAVTDRDRAITAQINGIRHMVKDLLPPFYKQFYQSKTNAQAVATLYQFLDHSGVIDQITEWRNTAVQTKDVNRSNQIEQVWNTFCSLLDECVAILGDHEFVAEDFWALIYAGFQGANYSQIPSTLDQVVVSETGMAQMNNRKITIIIGATDEMMPMATVNNNLFGDDDIAQIGKSLSRDQYLSDSATVSMGTEPYLNYLAFMSASEKLIFTYTNGADDSGRISVSPYVKRIQEYFAIKTQVGKAIPRNDDFVHNYIGSKKATMHHLVQVSQVAQKEGTKLSQSWQLVLKQLMSDPDLSGTVTKLLGSVNYQNTPVKLDQEIISGLYGTKLNISISQLESFYQNPYQYFLQYGLRLQERDEFELSSQSTGTFFHDVLDKIVAEIRGQNINLASLVDQDILELVAENVDKILADPTNFQYTVLTSSNRMQYITRQLEATVSQMVVTFRDQQKHTPMRPRNTELIFGQPSAHGLRGLKFALPENKSVRVRGRIDRIDQMQIDNKTYLGVVDYKSSDQDFDFTRAYVGSSMQLLTYLDVLNKNMADLTHDVDNTYLAGALYLHINDSKFKQIDLNKNDNNFEKTLLKSHKFKGFLVDTPGLVDNIDPLSDENNSLVFPFGKKTNGEVTARSKILSYRDIQLFLQHNEQLIIDAANRIFAGDDSLEPTRYKLQTSMQYSPYKAIMNFDPLMVENNYRQIDTMSKKEILDKLRGNH